MKIRVLSTAAVLAAGGLVLAGCSSNPDPSPTASPTTASPTSASPTQTGSKDSSSFKLTKGGSVKIAGQGAGTWKVEGGTMKVSANDVDPNNSTIEVAATGDADRGDFDLVLVTDPNNKVLSGTFSSPGVGYKVTAETGEINFLSTADSTTLVTVKDIPVQSGTSTPTTMTLDISGARE